MKNLVPVDIFAKTFRSKKSKSCSASKVDLKIKGLLLLLLCSFSLSAQDAYKGWGFETYYTPQYSDYLSSGFLKNDDIVPAYSYSIGLGFEKNIAKSWAINMGLVFQNVREKDKNKRGVMSKNPESLSADYYNNPGEFPNRNLEHFTVAIPITMKLFVQKGILRWYCRTGPQPEIHFQNKRIFIANPDSSNPFGSIERKVITKVNKVNLSWAFGIGMEVNLKNVLSVFVEPEGKVDLLKPQDIFGTRRYLAGLRVGVRGRFGREL